VTVSDVTGTAVTTLTATQVVVKWTSTGTVTAVNIVLNKAGSTIPTSLASAVTNSGSYTWMIPADLAAATYTITVSFSATIKATSSSFVKAAAPVATGCTDPLCSGHGECDEDTAGLCVCRYSYSGALCATAPDGILRLSTSLTVATPFATANADLVAFKKLFRTEIATALIVSLDQIEVKTVVTSTSGTKTKVTFDLLIGGPFKASALSLTSASELQQTMDSQLANSESGLNRGTQVYESASDASTGSSRGTSTGMLNGVSSARTVSTLTTAATLLAAVAAMAL